MTTLLLVLRKRKNKDGKQPLILQITKDRKRSIIHLGIHLLESEWDKATRKVKKSHANATRLNNYLIKKLSDASNESIELETNKPEITSKAVRQKIKREHGATFFVQAQVYLDSLKHTGKFNRFSADQPRIKYFREFLEGSDIVFSEINVGLLKSFQTWLKATRNVGERTVVNSLIVIRTIFNQAIASNLVDRKYYPFGKGKIVIRFPDTLKMGLAPEEVKAIEDLDLEKYPSVNHARNIWLFSFYFAGMRVSDVLRLKWTDIQDDRLHYAMGKNDKGGSLKVPEKALRIIAQYKRKTPVHNLIFPDLETLENLNDLFNVQSRINQKLRKINDALIDVADKAKITKKLTMHIARHTFGNISGDRIPLQMLQKLYRHSSITTTIGYQGNFIHKDADAALESVIML